MKKRVFKVLFTVLAICLSFSAVACGGKPVGPGEGQSSKNEDGTEKSKLYVVTHNLGIGRSWMDNLANDFAEKYKNVSFEEGKRGVQVIVDAQQDMAGYFDSSFKTVSADVVIADGVSPSNLHLSGDRILDLTDFVKSEASAFDLQDVDGNTVAMSPTTIVGSTSTAIENMLYDEQKATLASDGKYYAVPYALSFSQLTYNAKLWENSKLYFADSNGIKLENGVSSYTNETYTGRGFIRSANDKKSPGPDGVYDTFDDGMPSSLEEFVYLYDYMVEKGLAPLMVNSVNNNEYTNKIVSAFMIALSGKDEMTALFNAKTADGKTAKIVTGFNGEEPIIDDIAVNETDGYKLTRTASKYYALDLLKKVLVDPGTLSANPYLGANALNCSHTDAQGYFIKSANSSQIKKIGMIAEGTYWVKEAESRFKNTNLKEDLRVLPIPTRLTGSVNEGEGETFTVSDEFSMFGIINNNIKDNPVRLKLAKTFLRYAYSDEALSKFVAENSLPIFLKWEMPSENKANLNGYSKSVLDVYESALKGDTVVWPYSNSYAYLNNVNYYSTMHHTRMWKGRSYGFAYNAFCQKNAPSLRQVFEDIVVNESEWKGSFLAA